MTAKITTRFFTNCGWAFLIEVGNGNSAVSVEPYRHYKSEASAKRMAVRWCKRLGLEIA